MAVVSPMLERLPMNEKTKLVATVGMVTGATRHLIAGARGHTGVPPAVRVEIVEDGGAWLLRFDERGTCVADTWHATVEEAKAQARFEYAISADEWQPVSA